MDSNLANLLGGMTSFVSRSKMISRMTRKLPPAFKTYDYKVSVTFNLMTPEQNVNHAEYAKIFGEVRENFGLAAIPGFRDDIGKNYLLKTRNAYYDLISDFHFGDTMIVRMFVSEVNTASFELMAFYMSSSKAVKAMGCQKIVYTDLTGKPTKIQETIAQVLETFCLPVGALSSENVTI